MKFLFIWLFIFNISFLFAQTDIETTLGIGAPKNVLRQNELRFQAGLIIKDKLPEDVSGFVGSYSTYKTHINSLGLTDLGVIEFDTNNNPVYISANNVTDIDAPNGTQFTGIKGMDDFVSKILDEFH